MRLKTLSLLCNPYNGESLRYENNTLIGEQSKHSFPIKNGIPIFLSQNHLSWRSKWFRKFYDLVAIGYDTVVNVGNFLGINSEGIIRREYIGKLEIKLGDKILETAVGTASNLFFMPPEGDYYGVDISMQMLKRAKKKLYHRKRTAELFQANGEYLPFKDNSFDLVFQMGGLQFYSNPFRGLEEMSRVAKQGTTIHILDEKRSTRDVLKYRYTGDQIKKGYTLSNLLQIVPRGMDNIQSKILFDSDFYLLTFTKP
ncbi:MAG: methyltransferase domain-containing protein [Anaerolineales bacterium]|jgi:ubiquinone/menaquinone biosynthesis C-methylase UbiE